MIKIETDATDIEAWGPGIVGYSWDILPFYRAVAADLPDGAVCVELGVLAGRSVLFLAAECSRISKRGVRITGIDPTMHPAFGDHLHRLRATGIIRDECATVSRVTGWSAEESLRWPRSLPIDVVFVDGGHGEQSVREDILAWAPRLRPGGILAGHDYGNGEHPGVARAVDTLLGAVEHHATVWWQVRP